MATPLVFLGWASDDKVPGVYRETKHGMGKLSLGSFVVKVLITGTKVSAGSLVPDQSLEPIWGEEDATAKLGSGSTSKRQALAALRIPGVSLYAAPPAVASGAVAATLTATFGGTWSTSGTVKGWLGGDYIEVNIGATQVASDAGASLRARVNELADGLAAATGTGAAAVMTAINLGTQGNGIHFHWDLSEAPAGLTLDVTGGTAVHDRLVRFSGGTGTESLASVLNLLKSGTFDYLAIAQNDATNAALVEAHLASEAGILISHLEHAVFAHTGSLVSASSLSQVTLNDYRSCVIWYENTETHSSEIAATVGAIRSVIEPQNPNHNFDDTPIPGVVPQRYAADVPQHATLKAALNSGLSPLIARNSEVCLVRGIVSHCLLGALPDYRCLDWGDAVVPDRISKELGLAGIDFKADNPYVGPDAEGTEPDPVSGVGTPNLWKTSVYGILKDAEKANWLQNVDSNPPFAQFDHSRGAIVSAIPLEVRKQQHALGISVRQIAA